MDDHLDFDVVLFVFYSVVIYVPILLLVVIIVSWLYIVPFFHCHLWVAPVSGIVESMYGTVESLFLGFWCYLDST